MSIILPHYPLTNTGCNDSNKINANLSAIIDGVANGLSGSGTIGKLPKWSTASVLGDSIVSESGTILTVDGSLIANTISALATPATVFLTHTAGLIQSRTASQVLTDIGALSSAGLSNPYVPYWNGSNFVSSIISAYGGAAPYINIAGVTQAGGLIWCSDKIQIRDGGYSGGDAGWLQIQKDGTLGSTHTFIALNNTSGQLFSPSIDTVSVINWRFKSVMSGPSSSTHDAGLIGIGQEQSWITDSSGTIDSYFILKLTQNNSVTEKLRVGSDGLVSAAGRINVNDATDATTTTDGSLQTDGGLSVAKRIVSGDDIAVLADSKNIELGAGSDMFIYYDGTNGNIDTDLVAPSDLTIDCGGSGATAKTVVLEVPVYNDANVGALVLQTGGTLPGIVEILDNDGDATGIYTRGYAVGEQGSGVIEVPHDYKEGTDLVFHIHWFGQSAPAGGTDNVQWQLKYTITRDGQTTPDAITLAKETAITAQYGHYRSDFTTIAGATGGYDGGIIKIGDQFNFSVLRIAASSDEYGAEALVETIGFHYQCDTIGSRQIGTK